MSSQNSASTVEEGGSPPMTLKQRRKSNKAMARHEVATRQHDLRKLATESVLTDAQRLQKQQKEAEGEPSILKLIINAAKDKETPFDRLLRLKKIIALLSIFQILLAASMYTFAGLQQSTDETFTNVFGGVLAFFAALLGLWAAVEKSEFLIRLFFVAEVWLLNCLTTYMFLAADQLSTQQSLCSPSMSDLATNGGSKCHDKLEMYRGKLGMAVITIVFVLINCIAALDFNDAINDYHALQTGDEALAEAKQDVYKSHYMDRENIVTEDDSKWHLKVYGVEESNERRKERAAREERVSQRSSQNTSRRASALKDMVYPADMTAEEYAKL